MSTPWQETTLARSILASITPDHLNVRWCIDDPQSEDRFKLVGASVRMLQSVLDKHVEALMGRTLSQAQRCGRHHKWMAVYRAQMTVQEVLCAQFGDPNTLCLRMPLTATSWAYHAEWDRAFRAQFPAERRVAA